MSKQTASGSVSRTQGLLERVHDRIGGLGLDITTFGDGSVEVRWMRAYPEWSDQRYIGPCPTLDQALRAVIAYEDQADADDAREAAVDD
jgi:hypothetical protein